MTEYISAPPHLSPERVAMLRAIADALKMSLREAYEQDIDFLCLTTRDAGDNTEVGMISNMSKSKAGRVLRATSKEFDAKAAARNAPPPSPASLAADAIGNVIDEMSELMLLLMPAEHHDATRGLMTGMRELTLRLAINAGETVQVLGEVFDVPSFRPIAMNC